ncbi:ABC transporter ATP-binding protein [Candidatus Sumerlaeota bacterium]|nr:ABC transporter ATP-binding protein [Candidatus Sumerlaeota bacterium]
MFLLPFIRYLKPHRWRVAVAVVCMFAGGFFGVFNIFAAKPALDVLFGQIKVAERTDQNDDEILKHKRKLVEYSESDERVKRLEARWKSLYYPIEHRLMTEVVGASLFIASDFRRPRELVGTLRDDKRPLTRLIRDSFTTTTRDVLRAYDPSSEPSPGLMRLVTDDLNDFILQESIYRSDLFAGVRLSTSTLALVRLNQEKETSPVRLNRTLLEEAYGRVMQGDEKMTLYRYADKEKTKTLRWIAAFIAFMALIKGVLEYGCKFNLSYALCGAVIRLKSDIFRHIMKQDMRFFSMAPVGYLMSRITSDVNSLKTIFDTLIKNAVTEVVKVLFVIVALFVISAKMTTLAFVGILPALALLTYFAKVLKKNARKQKRRRDLLSSAMNESLYNVRLVKALSTEDLECDRFDEHNNQLFFYLMQRRMAKFAASPAMELIGSVGLGLVLIVGGWAVFHQGYDASTFLIYLFLLTQFYTPLKKVSRVNVTWAVGRVSADRIQEILALEPAIVDPPEGEAHPRLEQVQRGVSVRDVTFAYKDKIVLEGVSVDFERGKTSAIVGRSGSGKTTLANLLLRLYDPDSGTIEIDGIDIRRFRVKDLRSHFGIVTQETVLFNDTVARNIAYGDDEIDRDRMVEAARAAYAHDFVMALDGGKGYDTVVGPNGAQLSGGQRQRLAIARAFYRNPEILVLDEATSALDNESEAAVQKAIDTLIHNRTVVVIAHRLTTIMNADKIVVLDDGRVVEQGRHADLLTQGGHYSLLYRRGELADKIDAS